MELRNIHFDSGDCGPSGTTACEPAPAPAAPAAEARLRIRKVAVSPHQEYALRPGAARPISDALAALICCRKGRAEIGPKGISIERKDIGGKRIYHHVDSVICNDLSARERKIYYVLNALKPEVIHLLDDTGRYLESLPEKFMPGVLNVEEQKREFADQKRQVSRVARHLQELHGKDTEEAIATLKHNADAMKGIVQVLGTAAASPAQAPAPSPLGERIRREERTSDDLRATRKSALQLGRALVMDRAQPPAPAAAADEAAEDWSESPRHPRETTPTLTTPIESW
jgi:hypothetical protein